MTVRSCRDRGAESEWFIRNSKVGEASLLVVGVLKNLSNHEDGKNSSEFFEPSRTGGLKILQG